MTEEQKINDYFSIYMYIQFNVCVHNNGIHIYTIYIDPSPVSILYGNSNFQFDSVAQ